MKINFKEKKTITLLIVLSITVVLTGGLAFFYMSGGEGTNDVTLAPDFSSQSVDEINTWIEENELADLVTIEYEFSDTVAANQVISQSILAEQEISEANKLIIVISHGPDPDLMITLPDFTEMSITDIQNFFTTNQFSDVTYEYIVDADIPKDQFIKLNVETLDVRRSDLIVVSISIGSENVGLEITMPDFSDSSKANIDAWAASNNINVTYKTQQSDTVEKDKVIAQSVAVGEKIKTGDSITITLSLGQGVDIPAFAGKTKAEVDEWAEENEVKITYINYYAQETEKDRVISTSPKSGTLATGSTLKVYFSLGPVIVPDFTGKKEADVKEWIEDINDSIYDKDNYVFYKITEKDDASKTPGTILSTSPSSTNQLKFGETLTITVAADKKITVADQAGKTTAEFKTYIEGLGLKLGTSTQVYSDTIASGKIVSHDKGEIASGTLVNYNVSKGPFVPGTYTSLSACQIAINSAANQGATGWSCKQVDSYHATIPSGQAIETTVSGKVITVKISKGPEPVSVSVGSYEGKPYTEFLTFLTSNHLVAGPHTEEYHDTIPKGSIIRNDQGSLLQGSTVNYVVSKGKDEINIVALDIKEGSTFDQTKSNINNYLISQGFLAENITFYPVNGGTEGALDLSQSTPYLAGNYPRSQVFKIYISIGE